MNNMKKQDVKINEYNYQNALKEVKNDLCNINNPEIYSNNNIDIDKFQNGELSDVAVELVVHIGSMKIKIKDLYQIIPGTVVCLDKFDYETLDIFVNDMLIAKGELVHIKDKFGIRITKIINDVK